MPQPNNPPDNQGQGGQGGQGQVNPPGLEGAPELRKKLFTSSPTKVAGNAIAAAKQAQPDVSIPVELIVIGEGTIVATSINTFVRVVP